MDRADDIVRASEIGQYAYCARAWWLGRVKGYPSANVAALRQGMGRHRAHGRAVQRVHRLRWLAIGLLLLSAALLILWLATSLGS